jgi:3alpha(or 20beta)-hydroxysteroid dehydrogenase
MARLQGKVALITGGAQGLGASHARRFVSEGAKVVFTDVEAKAGKALAAQLGNSALFIEQDVTDASAWEDVVAQAEKAFGVVTVLVNNAGISGPNAFTADLAIKDFLKVMDVNVNGMFYGMRAVIPGMLKAGGGSIVNISSVAGFNHIPPLPSLAYTGSKFAVRGLTKAAAVEYARHNIRVNAVAPGGVMTPMAAAITPQPIIDAFAAETPMGRLGKPDEVSNAVLFLASDEASYMTGAVILVDGGKLR